MFQRIWRVSVEGTHHRSLRRNYVNSRRDLPGSFYKFLVRMGKTTGGEVDHVAFLSVKVKFLSGHSFELRIRLGGKLEVNGCAEFGFIREINLYLRVHSQKVIKTRKMVGVIMRKDSAIYLRKVDTQSLDVVLKDCGIVSGIEQDCFSIVMNECGIAPIESCSLFAVPESVV